MAFRSFEKEISEPGGVTFTDDKGYVWFEELIFDSPYSRSQRLYLGIVGSL